MPSKFPPGPMAARLDGCIPWRGRKFPQGAGCPGFLQWAETRGRPFRCRKLVYVEESRGEKCWQEFRALGQGGFRRMAALHPREGRSAFVDEKCLPVHPRLAHFTKRPVFGKCPGVSVLMHHPF